MKTIAEELNMLLGLRGYIVIDGRDVDLRPGQLIGGVHSSDGNALKHTMAVIQKTDWADWEQQQRLLGETPSARQSAKSFYRVTAE